MDVQRRQDATDRLFDGKALRRALGAYAMGVAVITTRDEAQRPLGITVNSFSSLSLDPPLVLWSIAMRSSRYAAFTRASYWVVHVLSHSQQDVARRFASHDVDHVAGWPFEPGVAGIPLLGGCLARFECRRYNVSEVGDHSLLLGEVLAFNREDDQPLLFFAGGYGTCGLPTHSTAVPSDG